MDAQKRQTLLGVLGGLIKHPEHPELNAVVAAARAAEDPELAIAACAALNARASLRPMDAPVLDDGAAHEAAELSRLWVDRAPAPLRGYALINLANALRRLGVERDADAQQAFARALELHPEKGAWWFDLGLHHKWRCRFAIGYDAFLKARARLGETKGVLWNLAICATGSGQGDLAAGSWRDLGFAVELNPASGLPQVPELPQARLRVPSKGSGFGDQSPGDRSYEVLWVAPISPCHGVVVSPSFQDTPVDYGDIVLWDGDPVGGPEPCFALLEVLRPGDEHRLRFTGLVSPQDLESLREALGLNVRFFASSDGPLAYGKLIFDGELAHLAGRWDRAIKSRKLRIAIPELYEKTADAKRAGQEHQAWRGIERAARKTAARE